MAISKIILNGVTQMDVTQDTVATDKLLSGYTATKNDGTQITGSYTPPQSPTIESLTVTPNETQQSFNGEVDGYKPVTVNAISSSYVGSGITRRSSSDLTESGATVSVPSGYYENNASKSISSGSIASASWSFNKTADRFNINYSEAVTGGYISTQTQVGQYQLVLQEETVTPSATSQVITPRGNAYYLNSVTVNAMPSGTEGTPTATKGTVSNHSVSVTPSVTNSAGYISGGTKTGTAVTVSASELVSGSETKTANGTYNVTNLASLVVALEFITVYTGSGNPSSSTGSNGDIYLKVVS